MVYIMWRPFRYVDKQQLGVDPCVVIYLRMCQYLEATKVDIWELLKDPRTGIIFWLLIILNCSHMEANSIT